MFLSLMVLYLLPDGSGEKMEWPGWETSLMVLLRTMGVMLLSFEITGMILA